MRRINMYYHICDHIYITQFQAELILLDVKKDIYTICSKQISDILMSLLKGKEFNYSSHSSPHILPIIQELIENNIIEQQDTLYPFQIDFKPASSGVSNVDWSLPLENKKISLNSSILKAFMILLKVNFYIKFKGLHAALQLIKKSRKKHLNYIIPCDEDLQELATVVNKACLIYPTRIKCLEWSMTYVLLALERRWKCNLEIGVQNYPFFAHAWVECNGKVVMDEQELKEGLAIILNEPFRKLKI